MQTGLRYAKGGPMNVEYYRDIKPILDRSCVACHTARTAEAGRQPGARRRRRARVGRAPRQVPRHLLPPGARRARRSSATSRSATTRWGYPQTPRATSASSSRGAACWSGRSSASGSTASRNDDHPSETKPGTRRAVPSRASRSTSQKNRPRLDLDFTGSVMPPPDAVAGGQGQAADRRGPPHARPLDRPGLPDRPDYDPKQPEKRGFGWMLDDQRPTLTLTSPQPGNNGPLTRILVGMHDYGTGLDAESSPRDGRLRSTASRPGENLAGKFKARRKACGSGSSTKPIERIGRREAGCLREGQAGQHARGSSGRSRFAEEAGRARTMQKPLTTGRK